MIDREKYPNCYKGFKYMEDCISGKQVCNIYVKEFCKKVKKDFTDKRFYFDFDWAEKFMRMFQKFEHVIAADSWKSKNITLEPWQCFIYMVVEGFYWNNNNKRKYKTMYCEVARGNGKSAMLSVVGLIYLCLYRSVSGNKILALAAKKEQARIVLDSAREMAKKNKSYLKHTGTEVFAHHIAHVESGSEFKAISSDSKTGDGWQPIVAIVDELHAHRDRALFDVMDSAMSKRPDSLMAIITTSGFSLEGIGYSQSCYAKKVALGEVPDETFAPFVYTLDEDDDWQDENVYIKANPNLGVSVDIDSFKSKAFKAKANPADEINFKVKHLNLWQNAAHQFFNIKRFKELKTEKNISSWIGSPCYVGIDLASKRDLTSFAYWFKGPDGKYALYTENFIPEMALQQTKNVNYHEWEKNGRLIVTPGNAINYDFIEKRFLENASKFKIAAAHYDPWNASEFSQIMAKEGVEMVEFRMTTANLSESMKRFDAIILEGDMEHDGDPLFEWCLSNVVAKADHNDNFFPRKNSEELKIDPAVAAIMGLAGWLTEDIPEGSVYETRGLITF